MSGGQSFRRHLIRVDMVACIPIDDNVFLDACGGHGKLNVRHSVKQSGVGDPLAACASGIRLPFAPDAGRRAFFRMSSMKKPMLNRRALCRLVFFCIFLVMMFMTWMIAAIRGYKPARTEKAKLSEVWDAFKECFWALLFPVILLVGIRMGLFTPSEVGAFACVYAAFVGVFIYKELNWKTFVQALQDTTRDVGAVMFIIAMSAQFGYGVPIDKVPQKVAEIMLGITNNPQLILILVILMLTVVGVFMEGAATILILTPILLPVIKSIGIDPVHFGMIICTVVTMGNCTPPVGLSMYTVNSIIDCSLGEYTKEMVPWLATFLIAMAILAFFPAPFMWLQSVLY